MIFKFNGGESIHFEESFVSQAFFVLRNGETTNHFGVHIEAVPAYNGNHPQGSDNRYVVTIGGKRYLVSIRGAEVIRKG